MMYITIFFSFSVGYFVETAMFVNQDNAKAWIKRRVNDEPTIYENHPERTPYIITRKFKR